MMIKVVLDREFMEKYVIVVCVEDEGKLFLSSVVCVIIVVIDENDNSFVFDIDRFRVSVLVDIKVGFRIFVVLVFDMDWVENGFLR